LEAESLAVQRPLAFMGGLDRRRLATAAALVIASAAAAYLRLYRLGEGGLGNNFYAAAVRSMSHSAHNFIFAAYDPLGTFTVDKPPLALWLQTAAASVFGFGGFALTLPQALAGVMAVALLFAISRRLHDDLTAFLGALTLAVLPASVLVSRNNTMDTLVMVLSLTGVALSVSAAAKGQARYLALAAVACGLAFNTKGFEAMVAVPGIVAYFWLASETPWPARARALIFAGVVGALVALSWVTATSLVPASDRPLVLNSDHNSELDLTFGYNGLDRILGGDGLQPGKATSPVGPGLLPLGLFYGGGAGPLRVFGEFPGPLIAVAIPMAFAGCALLILDLRERRKRAAASLWLLWFACGLGAFSASRLGSPHYFEAFSPALAACVGVASGSLLSKSGDRRALALAGAFGSGAWALLKLTHLGGAGSLIEALAVMGLAAAVVSALISFVGRAPPWPALAPAACLIAVLSVMSYQAVHDASIEGVQPGTVLLQEDRSRDVRYDPSNYGYSFLTGKFDYLNSTVRYLEARRKPGQYLVAVRSFYMASSIIASRDAPVLPIYSEFRNRPEYPADRLAALIDEGRLAYVLVSLPALRGVYPAAADLFASRCKSDVSRAAGLAPQTGLQLFQCR
jgi:4-amino-4-deoxy-L-arabinose transferase-like glycosyltransferase